MTPNHSNDRSIRTRAVRHPAVEVDSVPLSTPIYQSATFALRDVATALRYESEAHPASYYARSGNPTVQVLEKVLAGLEGGERALAFSSGMAAISTTLLALLQPGDHVVAGNSLYSDTTTVLSRFLAQLGVKVDFVDPADPEAFDRCAGARTRLFYVETPDNPNLLLTDIAAVARIARQRGALLLVDNTLASPCNQNPLALGADVVLHSATKYLCGHADVLAGAVVSNAALTEKIWRQQLLLGNPLDPHAAWLLLRGMQTLAVRVERQNENALIMARFLEGHPAVERVLYPGLESHRQHELARRQMRGFGGMVSFVLKGGKAAALRLVENTELIVLAVSLGCVQTLIEHPATMSHACLTGHATTPGGIDEGLVRLSVGIEDVGDLLDDLEGALRRVE